MKIWIKIKLMLGTLLFLGDFVDIDLFLPLYRPWTVKYTHLYVSKCPSYCKLKQTVEK